MNFDQNTYIYFIVAALTIYAIRALPLTLIQKEITNTFVRSFLYYVPYVTLAVMAFPAIVTATSSLISGVVAFVVAVVVEECFVPLKFFLQYSFVQPVLFQHYY